MAIRHSITLSTSEPNNEVGNLKIRQGDEQTQTLVANITENGVPKPFVGLQPFFCAKLGQTAGLGIIEQKVTGPMNPANGTLEYVMQPEDWQQLGRQTAYFSFRKMVNDHEWTEQFSTRDFNYNVTKSAFSEGLREVKKDGSTYVWTIEDMLRLFKEYIATGKIEWENYKNDERTIWETYRLAEKINWDDYKLREKNEWKNYKDDEKTTWEKFVEDNREFLENADPGGKIILELLGGRGEFDSLGERLDSEKAEVSAQLAQKANDKSVLLKQLNNGQVTKIKLIGDSITEGVGATGHSVPVDNPIIYDDGVEVYREANYTAPSWANKFRDYVNNEYPSVQFVNAGIGGKSTKWADANKQHWIDDNEDVVIVQLGTNDRHDSTDKAEFKTALTSFLAYVNERSNLMIVMTAPPTGNDYTGVYAMGMKEIDSVITDVCYESNYIHISNYRKTLEYSETTGAILDVLVLGGGSHPSDQGYEVVWKTLGKELGLVDNQENWKAANNLVATSTLMPPQYNYPILTTTPITDSIFKKGKFTIVETNGSMDDENLPDTNGKWTTYRGLSNDLYSYQTFEPRGKNKEYRRIWEYGTARWGKWYRSDGLVYNTEPLERTMATPITDFDKTRVEYCDINTTTGTPGNQKGTLVNYRGSSDVYGYQLFHGRQNQEFYKRYWNAGTSSWSKFQKIGGKQYYTTAERNALTDSELNQGDMVYDNSLHKPIWYKGAGIWVDATGATV